MTVQRARQETAIKNIISKFGGTTRVSEILNVHRTNVSKWKICIPGDHALKLYRYSQKKKMGIKLEELRPDIFIDNYVPTYDQN